MASLALAFDVLARDKATKTFNAVGDAADKAGKKGGQLGKTIGKGALIAGAALVGLGAAAVAGFGTMVKEAEESRRVGKLTEAVVKSTGGAAKVTAKQVGDLATAISNKTGMDDEAIQSGANMLLTFTKVRNETGKGNDIFNQATKAAADMSAALGTDMKGASLQLGKALNDPIKGVTALGRAGVSFTKQQKEQIKTLVESGDTLGAQKIILSEMQTQFGGAAEASGSSMDKLRTTVGNLREQIGEAFLPVVEKAADFIRTRVVPAVSEFVSGMQDGTGAGGAFAARAAEIVAKVKAFVVEFQNGTGAGGELRASLAQVVDVAKNVATWVGQNSSLLLSLGGNVGVAVAAFKGFSILRDVTLAVKAFNVALAANPIGLVVTALALLAVGLVTAYQNSEEFRNVVDTAFKGIGDIARWLWNTIFAPFFRFIVGGFAVMVEGIANFLDSLSEIPGFGWAKDAADKMHGAARKAGELAGNINDIPDQKNVNVDIFVTEHITKKQRHNQSVLDRNIGERAAGGPVKAGHPYIVGEKRPELFIPETNGTILPRLPGTSPGGSAMRLHPHDIEALADAMSHVRPRATIGRDEIDLAMARGAT